MFEAELLREHDKGEEAHKKSDLSSFWSSRRKKHVDPKKVTWDLMKIRESVRSLLKVHGVPRDTDIDVAIMGQQGAGCAGFRGITDRGVEFEKPYILMDRSVYERCDANEILDVYCGIALHEAGHINHTREFYKRRFQAQKDGVDEGRMPDWENILEDNRIERLTIDESPGFEAYIQAARKALLNRISAAKNWDKLPDMDKVTTVIFAYLRTPQLLTEEMREWTTLDGRCVYEDLKELFDRRSLPKTEDDVLTLAKLLEDYWKTYAEEFEKMKGMSYRDIMEMSGAAGGDGEGGGIGTLSREAMERIARKEMQDKADAEDSELREEKLGEPEIEPAKEDAKVSATKDLKKAGKIKATKTKESHFDKMMEKREGRRFGIEDLRRLMEETVKETMSKEETTELIRSEAERVEFHEEWSVDSSHKEMTRNTIVIHPQPDKDNENRYLKAYNNVHQHVAAMRNVFRLRLGKRKHTVTELSEGRLHRKMLARAKMTDRLFNRTYTRTDKGLDLCVVLDESGSMGHCTDYTPNNKAWKALMVATLIVESLKKVPGISTEVYSYGSVGKYDTDCLVKYLYGKKNPDVRSLGGYSGSMQNYDHMAIRTTGKLFLQNTSNVNKKMMIIVSDGSPRGCGYGGATAIRQTKEAVESLERKGIYVLQVAIESFDSERMFKHFVKYTNLSELVSKMRKLVTQIVRSVT